jgi:EAL domain-containing protein (putative c-di-GMP-specific phosphodiesterase class I)
MVEDAVAAMAAIELLVARGVGFSVDDFGTGYTSLAQLRGVPLVELKIDRTFVATVLDEPANQAIVHSMIALSRGLGCRVTAEGVETAEIADWLAAAGCDEAQGYYYSRPVPWPQISVPITQEAVR